MKSREAALAFVHHFHQVYLRFYSRQSPQAYRPSREAVAVLEHLARTGPLSVNEAAEHFERSQSAMSELLGRLEQRELVARFPDQRDRRRHLVWLTESGLATWRSASKVLSREELEKAFARLEPGRREAVVEALAELLDTTDS